MPVFNEWHPAGYSLRGKQLPDGLVLEANIRLRVVGGYEDKFYQYRLRSERHGVVRWTSNEHGGVKAAQDEALAAADTVILYEKAMNGR